jgi:hypothetical protein
MSEETNTIIGNRYEVINPVSSNKKPFYDFKRGLFVFPCKEKYRYYVETIITTDGFGCQYYILLSSKLFNEHCRLCKVDDYNRCKINVRGDIKDYIISETKKRGNINIEYIESYDDYDVYLIT